MKTLLRSICLTVLLCATTAPAWAAKEEQIRVPVRVVMDADDMTATLIAPFTHFRITRPCKSFVDKQNNNHIGCVVTFYVSPEEIGGE